MSYNLKGITLKINADSTGLQKEIARIKSEVKGINTTMSKLKNSMKFNSDDFTSVSAYQKLLSEKIANTTKQVKTYNKALAEYPKTQKQWANAITSTKNDLTTYQSALKNTEDSISKLTTTYKNNVNRWNSSLTGSKSTLAALKKEYAANETQINAWETAAEKGLRTIEQCNTAVSTLKNRNASLSTEMQKCEGVIKESGSNLSLLAGKHDDVSLKIKDMSDRQKELKDTISTLNGKVVGLGNSYEESQQKLATLSATYAIARNELVGLSKDFISTNESVIKMATSLNKVSVATDKLAGMTKYLSIFSGATLAAGTAAAISFEDAWTGVTKTVEGTPAKLEKVNAGLKELSTTTASTYQDVAHYAELAGQMGVPTDAVVGFTKVVTELGDTTNLVGEEAAQSLAKFSNIMVSQEQKTNDYYNRLGSTIVDLGNKFATTESDISEMSMRLAVAGRQVGFNSQQVLGLSTALSSLGIKANAGGGAISKMLKTIQLAVETGNDSLAQFAEVSGMTVDEFKKSWGEDAAGTFYKFCKGIGESTDGVTVTLDKLGIKEIRQAQAMGALAQSSDVLKNSLDTANSAWQENTAMATEAEKRYGTLKSKLSQTWEAIKQAGNELGQSFTPTLTKILDAVKSLALGFTSMSDESQQTVAKLLLFGAALSPTLKIISKLSSGVYELLTGFGKLTVKLSLLSLDLMDQSVVASANGFDSLASSLLGSAEAAEGMAGGMAVVQAGITADVPIIAGMAAALAAVAAAISYAKKKHEELMEATDKELKKDDALYLATCKVTDSYESFAQSIKSAKEESNGIMNSYKENTAKANALMSQIEQLTKVENLNSSQKLVMKEAVEQLNSIYPELNLKIDETSGKLVDENGNVMSTTDSLKTYVKQLQETAKEQAAANAYIKQQTILAEQKAELDALNETIPILQKRIREYYKEGEYAKANKIEENLKSTKEAAEELSDEIGITKKTIKSLGNQMNSSVAFDDGLKTSLENMKNEAHNAGIEIPKELAKGIEKGRGNVDKATAYLNAYNNYQGMINNAGSAGLAIPQEIAKGILNNCDTVKQQVDAMTAIVDFQNAINNAGLQGIQIPQVLANKIVAGATGEDGGITVQQAVDLVQQSVSFQALIDNAGLSGDQSIQALTQRILDGTEPFDAACAELVQNHGISKEVLADQLRAIGFTDDTINGIIAKVDEKGDDVTSKVKEKADNVDKEIGSHSDEAKTLGEQYGDSFLNGFLPFLQSVADKVTDLWNKLTGANNAASNKKGKSKKGHKSLDFSRISELPSDIQATYATPEIRKLIPMQAEIRDHNAADNLSARRLAMFNSATNVADAFDRLDLNSAKTIDYGSSAVDPSINKLLDNIFGALSKSLAEIEKQVMRIDTPIDATVTFVGTMDGQTITDVVTKNIKEAINGLNRNRGGR